MSKFTHVVAFAFGAAVGSIAAWKLLKTKYENWAQDEIDSVIETFSAKRFEPKKFETQQGKTEETEDEGPTEKTLTTDELRERFNEIVKEKEYTNEEGGVKPMWNDEPYVISPSEFGENDDYETISLTYYADGVLTDDNDEVIEDVDSIVGEESLTHFGEYEEDSVFVRNDELKCDYEILRDYRHYHPTTSEE